MIRINSNEDQLMKEISNDNNQKIMQVNLKKSLKYTTELTLNLDKLGIDIVAVQEPYVFRDKNTNKAKVAGFGKEFVIIENDKSNEMSKAAIVIRKNVSKYMVDVECTNDNMVVVVFDEMVVVSCYCNLVNEDKRVREIEMDLELWQTIVDKYANKKLMILSDTNARHNVWGDSKTNLRGTVLYDFILENNLDILNNPALGPTFRSYLIKNDTYIPKESYIDLSIINCKLLKDDFAWYKLDNFTNSDHSSIVISTMVSGVYTQSMQRRTIDFKGSNWTEFIESYKRMRPVNLTDLDCCVAEFNHSIKIASSKFLKYRLQRFYCNLP